MDKAGSLIAQLKAISAQAEKAEILARDNLVGERQYADFEGAFHHLRLSKSGQIDTIRLCNFTAEIEREIIKDDGLTKSRHFTVSGRLQNGVVLPTIDIAASDFDDLKWIPTEWGSGPQAGVGPRYKDHIVAAIKERSEPILEQIHQHTGWAEFGDHFYYLTDTGGIGADGLNTDIRCELPGSLSDYSLVEPVEADTLNIEEVLEGFRDLQKQEIGLILLGAVMRSTFCNFLPATCSVYLQGATGSYKSAIAGVLQGFWGTNFDTAHLPANWSSTGNALEKIAFLAKDALLVVDDFVARGTRQEVARTHANAERLLRAQGNQAGRSRMTAKAELRNAFHPRGLVLATGEDIPNGHSLQARLVIINVAKGAVDLATLTHLQKHVRDGTLSRIMASFIQWLAFEANEGKLHEAIKMCLDCDRQNVGEGGHARTQDNLANLLTGLRMFLDFAEEAGELSFQKTEMFMDLATRSARGLLDLQTTIDREASDAQRFVDLLRAAVTSGRAHIEQSRGGQPDNARALGWREVDTGRGNRAEAMGVRVGWVDDELIYIDPNAALSVVKAIASGLDNHLGSSDRAIAKSLREAGLLVRCDKGRNTAKVSVLGARRQVYVFKTSDLFDFDGTSANPIGYLLEDIPF